MRTFFNYNCNTGEIINLPRIEEREFNMFIERSNYWKVRIFPEVQISIRIEIHVNMEECAKMLQDVFVLLVYMKWPDYPQGKETGNDDVKIRREWMNTS